MTGHTTIEDRSVSVESCDWAYKTWRIRVSVRSYVTGHTNMKNRDVCVETCDLAYKQGEQGCKCGFM